MIKLVTTCLRFPPAKPGEKCDGPLVIISEGHLSPEERERIHERDREWIRRRIGNTRNGMLWRAIPINGEENKLLKESFNDR